MKNSTSKILAFLLALTLTIGLLPVYGVQAEEAVQASDIIQTWIDDFSSGKGGSYTPHGWWWNMDGQLTVGDSRAGAGVCYYWLNDYVWDDFVMEFDVINQTAEFGVIFRAQQTTGNDCQNQGYGVLSDTNWAFFMAENGTFSNLDSLISQGYASTVDGYGTATQPGTANVHWKIVAKGNRIEVYFNHAETPQMVMDATLYQSGAIGFRTNNPGGAITAVVDNLSITEIVEENNLVTWTDDFSSGKGGSYTPYGYWWNQDGVLTAGDTNAGAGVSYYWLKDYLWKDFVMEFDVINQSAQFGVIFGAQKASSVDSQSYGYGVLYDTSWAFFMAENGKFSNLSTMISDGIASKVDGYGNAAQPGTSNAHWKIVVKDSRVKVYFNHATTPQMVMDATSYEGGLIGFRTWNSGGQVTAVVDNLSITGIVEPTASWTDDFSSGKGDSYTPYGYWWNQDGVLTAGDTNATAGVSYYWLKDYVWKDFTMEFDVISQSAQFGVIFGAQKESSVDCQSYGYGVLYDTSWAFFMAENGKFSNLSTMISDGIASKVDGYGYAAQPGTSNAHWKIVVEDSRVKVYFNNATTPQMVMDATSYEGGLIGFRTWNSGAKVTAVIDNLSISGTVESAPVEDEPDTPAENTIEAFDITWIPYGGSWALTDGGLDITGDSATVWPKLISDSAYQHFTIEADLVGVRSGGIVFRSNDPAVGADAFGGYYVGYDSNYAFFGKDAGGWSSINTGGPDAIGTTPLAYKETMHWKLEVSGNTFTLYVDDMETPLIQNFDNTFTAAGGVGFRVLATDGQAAGRFENVVITPIAEEDAKYTTEGTYDLWAKRLINEYPAEDNQGKIILMGASHMEFWQECNEDLAPYEILNFGMGGSRVDHIAGKNDTMLIPYAPKAVIVSAGGNDVSQGRDTATVTAATKAYLESVRTDLPGVPIIYFNNWISPSVQDNPNNVNTRKEINELMKQWCQSQEDIYYFDCSSVVIAEDSEIWLSDRMHMNATGYDKLTVIFKPYLEAVLNGTVDHTVVTGWNVVLGNEIGMNFVMDLAEGDQVACFLGEQEIASTLSANEDGTYNLRVAVAAAQMADELTIKVNGEALSRTYSVRAYADHILTGDYDDATKALVREMLNYGAASQTYFGYNTENLANAGITVTAAEVPAEGGDFTVTGSADGISFYGASLVHQKKIAVRFYFTAESVEGVDFGGYTPVAKDGKFYIEVADINPQDLNADITVTVNDSLTVSYSPLDYIIRMYAKGGNNAALVQALYGYYLAAAAYTG